MTLGGKLLCNFVIIEDMKECMFYDTDGDSVRCRLCPHGCRIAEGQTGLCRSRKNIGGKLYSMVYGCPCAIADDPIEKKPLAQWHPGTRCLSIACTGCNLRCPNCQNSMISQANPGDTEHYHCSPDDIVSLAQEHNLPTIAYTYTEPLTWFEYVYDTATKAHDAGINNVLVSAGFVEEKPLRMLAPLLDAANIDLKSFSDDTYRHFNHAQLAPVLRTLLILKESGVHLEITMLLIPGINTDSGMQQRMFRWIKENGLADCPLHITRFFPAYKMMDACPTPLDEMRKAEKRAEAEGIKHVYLGNV